MRVTTRHVDGYLWRKFRAKVEEKRMLTGKALEEAIKLWLEENT